MALKRTSFLHVQSADPKKSGGAPNDTLNLDMKFKGGTAVIVEEVTLTLKTLKKHTKHVFYGLNPSH